MKYAKRVMSLTLVMGLMVSSLTGCTSRLKVIKQR